MSNGRAPVGSKAWLVNNFGLVPGFSWSNSKRIVASYIRKTGPCQYVYDYDYKANKLLETREGYFLVKGI